MKDFYLLDSNILSALLRPGNRREGVVAWMDASPAHYTTSVVVLYEIESGLLHRGYTKLMDSFQNLLTTLEVDVLDVTREIAHLAATHRAEGAKKGLTYHGEDLLIGATALCYEHRLVTANVKDFEAWIPDLINPIGLTL